MKCSRVTKTGNRCKNGVNCPIHRSRRQQQQVGGGFLIKSMMPYIGSIYDLVSSGKVPSPLSILKAIKDQKEQYGELLKDVENAFNYYNEIKEFMKTPNYKMLCNATHFETVFLDFEKLLAKMNDDSSIRILFNKQIIKLNNIVQKYDKTKNIETYIQDIDKAYQQAETDLVSDELQDSMAFDELQDSMAFEENVFGLKNEISIKSYPVKYRTQLNYMINRLNMLIDSLSINDKKKCIMPKKLKIIQPKHVDFTQNQEEEFYDTLSQIKN